MRSIASANKPTSPRDRAQMFDAGCSPAAGIGFGRFHGAIAAGRHFSSGSELCCRAFVFLQQAVENDTARSGGDPVLTLVEQVVADERPEEGGDMQPLAFGGDHTHSDTSSIWVLDATGDMTMDAAADAVAAIEWGALPEPTQQSPMVSRVASAECSNSNRTRVLKHAHAL